MTKLRSRKLHCPKVTKMGSIIGLQINYNGRGQRHITQQKLTRVPPPPPPPHPGPGLAPVYVNGLFLDPFCLTKHLPVNNGNTKSALKIAIHAASDHCVRLINVKQALKWFLSFVTSTSGVNKTRNLERLPGRQF